jgi:glycosyltransferase involved in cell wall biosynthesis
MELSKPLVSVLMPAYNAEPFVAEAIKGVLNQTYSNLELLIADDASTDNTKNIVSTFSDSRIKLFHNDKNLGYLQTWNKLIKEAKGEYITFQDADDLCALNRIELLVEVLDSNRDVSVVSSNFTRITSDNRAEETSDFPTEHTAIQNAMPQQFYFIGSALMIRKIVYETIGGYHTFFDRMGAEDHYWVYLVLEKFKMTSLKEALYHYRFNENSVSGNISNNPSKINAQQICAHLIAQRRATETDDLQEGKDDVLKQKLAQLNKPFVDDSSYYYYYVAKRRFYEGHKGLAIKNMWKAIQTSPWRFNYYKDLFYFLRK